MTAKTPAALGAEFASTFADGQQPASITPARYRPIMQDLIDSYAGSTAISVVQYGAKGDGVTDDTTAFQNAIAAVAAGGVLWVAMPASSYLITGTLTLSNVSMSGMGGIVPITFHPAAGTTDCINITAPTGSNETTVGLSGFKIDATASKFGRDLVRVGGGVSIVLTQLVLNNAGRDSLHVEANSQFNYTELLTCMAVKSHAPTRDHFHFESGNTGNTDYINQIAMYNCVGRSPGRYALVLINNDTAPTALSKISVMSWFGGELDFTGSGQNDGCLIQTTTNGTIEDISFYECTIEDVNNLHTGWAITTARNSGNIGAIYFSPNVIAFGAASGRLNTAGVNSFAVPFNAASASAQNPTGTTSLTGVMMGLAFSVSQYTRPNSGRFLVTVTGTYQNSSASGGVSAYLRWGTGTAPANGAALAGNPVGKASLFCGQVALAGTAAPFSLSDILTGVQGSGTLWLDLGANAVGVGTASVGAVVITVQELPLNG